MSEPDDGRKEPLSKQRAEALSQALASSIGNMTQMWERQLSTVLAIAALVAAMPQTAEVDSKKLGAVIQFLSSKQRDPEKLRDEMGRMTSMIIKLSRRLRHLDLSQGGSDNLAEDPTPAGAGDERV